MTKPREPVRREEKPDEWREMRDFQSRSNYHYDGRMVPGYTEPRYTAVGILLIAVGVFSTGAVLGFAPYDKFASMGLVSFVVDYYAGLLFAGVALWGGIHMVRRNHGKRHAGELEAAASKDAAASSAAGAPATAAPKPAAKRDLALRVLAALLLVAYFLPHYDFIRDYGISAIGLTTGQYKPFLLVGPWYLAFLGILPILLLAVTAVRPLLRFQHVAAAVVAGLDLAMLFVLQGVVDGFGLRPADMTRAFGFYVTLALDLLLLAYVLGHAVVWMVRRMCAHDASGTP